MSLYEAGKLIHDIFVDESLRTEFRSDPNRVFSKYKLTNEEKEAIVKRDYIALYASGIHPVLLFHFAQTVDVRDNFMKEVIPKLAGVRNAYYDYYSTGS